MHCFTTFKIIFRISSSEFMNSFLSISMTSLVYSNALSASIKGMIKPIAFKNAARLFPLNYVIPSQSGISTLAKASIPYGAEASARAASARLVIVLTLFCSSFKPCSIISTRDLKCGRIAHPMRIAIC